MDNKYEKIFEKDMLGIRSNVIGLAHLIEQEGGEAKVYSVSAEFGIGKTFFCDRLHDVLALDKVPVAKMNIWEMDFYEGPLIPILIKIQEVYAAHNDGVADFPNPSKMLNLFKSIVAGITIDVKAPLIGNVKIEGEKIIKNGEQLRQKSTEIDIYADYKQYKIELDALKGFLRDWASDIKKPIVVIIDEMDRCRPDYAVKTLEVLKHFFNISGFVFILALDEEQLRTSVKCLYGTENFDGYKRKFINNSFILPPPDKMKFVEFLYEKTKIGEIIEKIKNDNRELVFQARIDVYRNYLARNWGIGQPNGNVKEQASFNDWQTSEAIIKRYFTAYSIWFKFSLRRMEQTFDRLVLFIREISTSDELFSPDLAVLLVCLHEFDNKIYDGLRKIKGVHDVDSGGIVNEIWIHHNMKPSIAKGIYKENAIDMFDKFDRDLAPKVPELQDYSTDQGHVFIRDNVDRFFDVENNQERQFRWLYEFHDKNTGTQNNIDTNGVLAYIISDKRNAQWTEPEPDIITEFDKEKFRQIYFSKMDFLSEFKSSNTI